MWTAFVLLAVVAALPVRRVGQGAPVLGGVRGGIYGAELTVADTQVLLAVDTGSPALGVVQRGWVTFVTNAPCPAPPSGLVDLSSSRPLACFDLPACPCREDAHGCVVTLSYLDGTQAEGNVYSGRTSLGNGTTSLLVGVTKTRGRFSNA